jgi:hypothetical protein
MQAALASIAQIANRDARVADKMQMRRGGNGLSP